jgi:hypothetical protein
MRHYGCSSGLTRTLRATMVLARADDRYLAFEYVHRHRDEQSWHALGTTNPRAKDLNVRDSQRAPTQVCRCDNRVCPLTGPLRIRLPA